MWQLPCTDSETKGPNGQGLAARDSPCRAIVCWFRRSSVPMGLWAYGCGLKWSSGSRWAARAGIFASGCGRAMLYKMSFVSGREKTGKTSQMEIHVTNTVLVLGNVHFCSFLRRSEGMRVWMTRDKSSPSRTSCKLQLSANQRSASQPANAANYISGYKDNRASNTGG